MRLQVAAWRVAEQAPEGMGERAGTGVAQVQRDPGHRLPGIQPGNGHQQADLLPPLREAKPGGACSDSCGIAAIAASNFMDQRGYGGMQGAHGEYSIAEIAADAPARVRALVGIAPVPCGGIAYDAATFAFLEGAAQQLEHRRTIIDRSTGGRLPPAWIDWKARYSAVCSSPGAFAAYLQAWAQTDFSAALRGTHPVKLLVGEHDPTFTAARMAQTYGQRYRSVSIEVLANAGHYPMNETPLALVAAIESFLHSAAGSA